MQKKEMTSKVFLGIIVGLITATAGWAAELTSEERQNIEKAIPEKATVTPKKPRKLLVVTLDVWDGKVRSGHASMACGNYALELMGKKTGAYEVLFSNDVNMFRPENIGQFDAICFNNTTGVLFDDPQLKKSLLEFIYSGKGFVGIHAAGATFVQWPEYGQWPAFGEMLGGYENGGHPWKANETITLKLDDPEHPVNAGFNRKGFEISDEVFQFQTPIWSRDKLRVLVSIDTDKTDMSPQRRILPERQKDKDIAISWVRNYGRGRVFYTSFGHNKLIYWNAPMLRHFLDGIQFALGDLDAPTTPSGKLTPAVRNRELLSWRLGIGMYSFKDDPFDKALEKAAALGAMYIEGGPKFDISEDEIISTREKLLAANIRMVSYYIHKIPNDEKVIKQLFEFCRKLGVETIVGEPEPEAMDLLEKYCEKYDINLAIHNHTKDISPFYYDPNNVLKVCQGRSRRIGACPDIGYWIRAGYDPIETLRKMKDRIITFHIHDVHESGAAGHDVPWGTGAAKLEEFIKEEYKLEIKPTLWAVEYAYDWQDNTKQIAQSMEFFDKVVGPLADYERSYVARTKGVRRAAGVTDEQRVKIEGAIPDAAPATPKKARKLLVFNRNTGYGGHPSIPHATLAVQLMGEKTGAYQTVVSDDPNIFNPKTLKEFDAVFLNNTVGNLFEEKDLRDSFLDFVNRGGGLLANHGSAVAFTNWSAGGAETWPEFGKMLGARGASHREATEKVMAKLDDPGNPLNAAFGGKSFEFTDEFFRFHEGYSRDNVHVLFSIDVGATDMNQGRCYGKCERADNDYAIAWVKSYGKGRVYYNTIGHNPYVFWDPVFLKHFLAAIQFALGDIDASTEPSGKVSSTGSAKGNPDWRLAVQFWSFNRFSFYEAVEKTKSLGVGYAEAFIFGPTTGQALNKDNPRLLFSYIMPAEKRQEVKQRLSDTGIRMVNCYIGGFPNNENQCRKIFEFAKEMGIETFVGEPDPNQLDMLEKLCDEYEINLAIHNHRRGESRYWDPQIVMDACKGRSKQIGACADTGHWMRSGIDPVAGLKTLEGRVIALHLKDLNKLGDPNAHDMPWGMGKADVPAVLAELKRQDFKGVIAIEYEYNWDNSMPDIAECIKFFKSQTAKLGQ